MTREEAETLCLLHAKVARAFAYLIREKEGTPKFAARMSEWLQADLAFLAAIVEMTEN